MAGVLLAGTAWFGVLGCANQQPPPGVHPDARPPRVARIVPGRDTVVPGFRGAARVTFDEPVSLGTGFERQIATSPALRYEVHTGFSHVAIRPRGGWREGVVYCFELPAGIADLLRNRTEFPVEFCFSTGPPVTETVVEGRMVDRVTGAPVPDGRVLFLALSADTTPYTAAGDRQGSFRLRALPPGSYWAFGFRDRNGDLRLQRHLEAYDSARFTLEGATSVAALELALTEPDTTPPVLVDVGAPDSLTVRLRFDDFLEPVQERASVAVVDSAGSVWPVRSVRVGEPSTGPEAAPSEAVAGARVPAGVSRADTTAPSPPSRTVGVLLGEPLRAGRYRITATGFVNLRGLVGGGDTTFVFPPAGKEEPGR